MADLSPHQRKIVERYYEHKDEIMLTRLQELVTEIYLATTEKKLDSLWKRVELAMKNLKVPAALAAHIMSQRKAETLAQHVNDWLKQARGR